MNVVAFTVFTVAVSGLWNSLLIGLGAALGTQYQFVDRYSRYMNYAVYLVLAAILIWLVLRRVRRHGSAPGPS